MQFLSALPVTIRHHGIDANMYGRIMAVNGFMVVVFQPLVTRLMRNVPRKAMMMTGCMLIALGVGAQACASTPVTYAACVAVWSLGEIAFFAVAAAYVASLAPKHRMGTYQGAYQMTRGMGQLLAPWLGMAVLEQYGAQGLWFGCAASIVLAVSAFVAISTCLPAPAGAT